MDHLHQVLIIGGGAGGLELATKLGNTLGKKKLAKITLVDKHLSYVWKPLWHEVAAKTREICYDEINYINHANSHYFDFHLGNLIELNQKDDSAVISEVRTNGTVLLPKRCLHYDTLVIAIGSVHNNFDLCSVENYALFLDSLEECKLFSNKLIEQLVRIYENQENNLDIVIIGGGTTGIELAFEVENAIAKFFDYQNLSSKNIKINICIIDSNDKVLSSLSEDISLRCTKQLKCKKIKIYLKEQVIRMDREFVYLKSGNKIKANIKLWAAGIKCPNILEKLGLKTNDKNQLLIHSTLQATHNPKIFAIGDCCNFTNGLLPANAKLAHQQAKFLARSITRIVKNEGKLLSFKYKDYGTVISTIEHEALGEINIDYTHKLPLGGKLAYISYRLLYRKYQISLHGVFKTCLFILSDFFAKQTRPRIKFH